MSILGLQHWYNLIGLFFVLWGTLSVCIFWMSVGSEERRGNNLVPIPILSGKQNLFGTAVGAALVVAVILSIGAALL